MTEPPRMDPDVRAEWVRRLRSGDYLQGTGELRSSTDVDGDARYCCLGVLCEVARDRGVVSYDRTTFGYRSTVDPREGSYDGVLPPAVQAWAGLLHLGEHAADPLVQTVTLSCWNDGTQVERRSFAWIADAIEEEL